MEQSDIDNVVRRTIDQAKGSSPGLNELQRLQLLMVRDGKHACIAALFKYACMEDEEVNLENELVNELEAKNATREARIHQRLRMYFFMRDFDMAIRSRLEKFYQREMKIRNMSNQSAV